MARQEKNALTRELAGIFCLLVSILLACSLFSFDPRDIHRNPPTSFNWIGIVGAYLGYVVYSFFGWSANLLPLAILFLGVSVLFRENYGLKKGSFWTLGFIVSLSCLIQVLGGQDTEIWKKGGKYLSGWGGLSGLYIGGKLFWRFLKHGASIIFVITSGASLFMALQMNPKEVYLWIREFFEKRKIEKREEVLRTGDLKTVLRTREEEIAERQKLIERELARRSKAARSRPQPQPVETELPLAEKKSKSEPKPEPAPEPKAKEKMQEKVVEETTPPPEPVVAPADVEKLKIAEYKINRPAKAKTPKRPPPQPTFNGPYYLPPLELLQSLAKSTITLDSKEEIAKRGALIETTLKDFGIEVQMGEITQGSTVTRYEVVPSPGVKVERIVNLQNNLSLALKADKVNILAPVAGKGTVGIEVANVTKVPVLVRDLIESPEFQNAKARIPLALGKDVYGKTLIADLAEMPHLLIAGSTGSGKSVCINSIITSILYKFSPEDMRLILIDPKVVELQVYNALPHLVVPVVSDPKKIIVAFRWIIREMEKRYKIMAKVGVRSVAAFNSRPKAVSKTPVGTEDLADLQKAVEEADVTAQPLLIPEDDLIIPDRMPFIVVVVDELADLMLTAPVDAEDAITRITQMARAAGIHLIVATQTPRADVVTGTIKTNLPSKIAFRVASKIDSRVILDENGAENLLGKGDMIYKSSDSSVLRRSQGAFISDDEVRAVVDHSAKQMAANYDLDIQEKLSKNTPDLPEASEEDEELVNQCIQVIQQEGRASTSLLQRRLRLGYTRAARIMDLLEERGVVGPSQGARDREILISLNNISSQK